MELVEVVKPYLLDCLNAVMSHTGLTTLAVGVSGILLLLRAYTRLTMGVCNCDTSMVGKTVIITGANAGIGKETARELAKYGAKVILACRNPERGERAKMEIIKSTGNKDVILKVLDLNSFDSVRKFAKDILNTEERVDILINNAGILAPHKKTNFFGLARRETTTDGYEIVMQSNHLGHFLLTHLLLDLIKKSAPSRIINVSSASYKGGDNNWDDIQHGLKYSFIQRYSNSKLANVHFTTELSKRLDGTGVTVNCLHPGMVKTEIMPSFGPVQVFFSIAGFVLAKNALQGAQTTLHLALSEDLEKVTGKYFSDCKEEKLTKAALKEESSKKLWSLSESIVGLSN